MQERGLAVYHVEGTPYLSVTTIIDVIIFTLFDGLGVVVDDRATCRSWYVLFRY
jgi:hypothetical protein